MPSGGYRGAGGQVGRIISSRKQVSFKSGFESRERVAVNTAGGSEFQVRGAAVIGRIHPWIELDWIRRDDYGPVLNK